MCSSDLEDRKSYERRALLNDHISVPTNGCPDLRYDLRRGYTRMERQRSLDVGHPKVALRFRTGTARNEHENGML